MLVADIDEIMRAMRVSQRALAATCDQQNGNWRHDVVRLRRALSEDMARLGARIAAEPGPASPALIAFRNVFSPLRSALAELQAGWPAVSLDTTEPSYHRSVNRVRAAFDALDRALAALDRAMHRAR